MMQFPIFQNYLYMRWNVFKGRWFTVMEVDGLEKGRTGSLYHFLQLKTIFCQQLQHLLTGDIYKYICSIFTMEMYLLYCMILLFLFTVFMFCYISLNKCADASCLTVDLCWFNLQFMSYSKFDIIIIMYVMYLFCVLSCLNLRISSEFFRILSILLLFAS